MAPLFSDTCNKRLDGQVVAITGPTTGIGKVTARDIYNRGARVLLLARDVNKAKDVVNEFESTGNEKKGTLEIYQMDLASLKSVRECANAIGKKEKQIDILINNAGVAGTSAEKRTEDGFEMMFGTNHLGHFLLTELLLPLIKKAVEQGGKPRIVNVSSFVHQFGQMFWDDLNLEKNEHANNAYSQSKLANVLHANELAHRLEGTGITASSLHPGAIMTDLPRHMQVEDKRAEMERLSKQMGLEIISLEEGAQTTLYCALEPKLDGVSGKYFSDCAEKEPAEAAKSIDNQEKLREISEKLVGFK